MQPAEAKRLLEDERRRVRELRDAAARAFDDDATTGELSTLDQHDADIASELHVREVDETLLERFDLELEEIDAALQRVADGTYGRCLEDGAPIPDERLEAVPAARYCAVHQKEREALS